MKKALLLLLLSCIISLSQAQVHPVALRNPLETKSLSNATLPVPNEEVMNAFEQKVYRFQVKKGDLISTEAQFRQTKGFKNKTWINSIGAASLSASSIAISNKYIRNTENTPVKKIPLGIGLTAVPELFNHKNNSKAGTRISFFGFDKQLLKTKSSSYKLGKKWTSTFISDEAPEDGEVEIILSNESKNSITKTNAHIQFQRKIHQRNASDEPIVSLAVACWWDECECSVPCADRTFDPVEIKPIQGSADDNTGGVEFTAQDPIGNEPTPPVGGGGSSSDGGGGNSADPTEVDEPGSPLAAIKRSVKKHQCNASNMNWNTVEVRASDLGSYAGITRTFSNGHSLIEINASVVNDPEFMSVTVEHELIHLYHQREHFDMYRNDLQRHTLITEYLAYSWTKKRFIELGMTSESLFYGGLVDLMASKYQQKYGVPVTQAVQQYHFKDPTKHQIPCL